MKDKTDRGNMKDGGIPMREGRTPEKGEYERREHARKGSL